MNKKSKGVLQRYLTKLDANKIDGEFQDFEFDARFVHSVVWRQC
jgi:hypothetical protein